MKERLSHLFICCCVQVGSEDEVDHFSKKKNPSNSDETGPGERTREGDHRLKVGSEDEVDHNPSNSDETGPGERTREGDHRLKV
ncbi:hypothetical protein EMCRGX_G019376 [Ephydatia muelleri]